MNYLLEYFFNSDGFLKKEEMILGLILSAMSLVNPKLRKFNNGISINQKVLLPNLATPYAEREKNP